MQKKSIKNHWLFGLLSEKQVLQHLYKLSSKTNIYICRVSVNLSQNCLNKLFKGYTYILGLDYKDASLITLYYVVLGIITPKIRWIW